MRSLIHKKQRHTNDAKPVVDVKDFDDWHEEKGTVTAGLVTWVCPEGLYEVFVFIPLVGGAHNEYLDNGTDNNLLVYEQDSTPSFPANAFWYPNNLTLVLSNVGDNPTIFYSRAKQGWIMSTGEILRNNATTDPFTVRYRKLR